MPIPAILKPKPLWTGKQILSLTIPRGINIHCSPDPKSSHPVFDDGVLIENGKLIFGIVENKTVGASQGGLVHVVFRERSGGNSTALYWPANDRQFLALPQWLQHWYRRHDC